MVQQRGVEEYINKVLGVLARGPEVIDIQFLVEAYGTVGWYAQEAEREYDLMELNRKLSQASATLRIKSADPKATANVVEAKVMLDTQAEQNLELAARAESRKLKSLQDSIEQAINALKFLGRNDSVRIG